MRLPRGLNPKLFIYLEVTTVGKPLNHKTICAQLYLLKQRIVKLHSKHYRDMKNGKNLANKAGSSALAVG